MKFKRILSGLCAVIIASSAAGMTAAAAQAPLSTQQDAVISGSNDYTSGFYKYTLVDYDTGSGVTTKCAKLTEYNGVETDVVIPGTIDGYSVAVVGDRCFANYTMSSVTIPDSVKEIGSFAFTCCTDLVTVNFPESGNLKLGDRCFKYCDKLQSVDLRRVTSIGSNAFEGCSSLYEVLTPTNIAKMGGEVFEDTAWLNSMLYSNNYVVIDDMIIAVNGLSGDITLPSKYTRIADHAFANRTDNITSVTIPDTVTFIGDYAFSYMENLSTVIFPDKRISVGKYTFAHDEKLTSIKLPNCMRSIPSYGFYGCSGLKTIDIPGCVELINIEAFAECTSLSQVNFLPKTTASFLSIEPSAFLTCPSLYSITLPRYVTDIELYGLGYCYDIQNNNYVKTPGFTIYGYKDSYAPEYAKANGFKFVDLEEDPVTPDPKPAKKSLAKATVKASNKTYTGKALTPAVTVKLNGKTLKKGTDYTAAYKNNKNCGKATVTVTGKGSYTGSKSASFIIKPAKITIGKLTCLKKRQIKLTWKKTGGKVTGYHVQIAFNKKFSKGKKSYFIKKSSASSKTIKKLKKNATYYARVRAYKTVGGKKYFGKWSAVKSVKCK